MIERASKLHVVFIKADDAEAMRKGWLKLQPYKKIIDCEGTIKSGRIDPEN